MSEPPTTEPRRAIDFERCPVCDNMAVVRLPDDWQEQDRSIPIIACGNPWHYATRSLGDGPDAAPRAERLDVERLLSESTARLVIAFRRWCQRQGVQPPTLDQYRRILDEGAALGGLSLPEYARLSDSKELSDE